MKLGAPSSLECVQYLLYQSALRLQYRRHERRDLVFFGAALPVLRTAPDHSVFLVLRQALTVRLSFQCVEQPHAFVLYLHFLRIMGSSALLSN